MGNGLFAIGRIPRQDQRTRRALQTLASLFGTSLIGDGLIVEDGKLAVDHNLAINYDADQHVDHTTVTITGAGVLAGGGDISASRTLTLTFGTGLQSDAGTLKTKDSEIVHQSLSGAGTNTHAQIDTHVGLTNEHIDWTNASAALVTSSTGQFARAGIGTTPHASYHLALTPTLCRIYQSTGGIQFIGGLNSITLYTSALNPEIRVQAYTADTEAKCAGFFSFYGSNVGIGRVGFFGFSSTSTLDFEFANECEGGPLYFCAGGYPFSSYRQVKITDGTMEPAADNDLDLGAAAKRYKDFYLAGTAYLDGDLDHDGTNVGFFNTAPAAQPAAIADATDAAEAISQLNLLLAAMRTLGLIASS